MFRPTGKATKIFDSLMQGEEMPRKKQGYKDRLDESLGERHKGRKKQSLKDRRDESEGMERHYGRRPYAAVGTMDVGRKKTAKKPTAKKKGRR